MDFLLFSLVCFLDTPGYAAGMMWVGMSSAFLGSCSRALLSRSTKSRQGMTALPEVREPCTALCTPKDHSMNPFKTSISLNTQREEIPPKERKPLDLKSTNQSQTTNKSPQNKTLKMEKTTNIFFRVFNDSFV